MTFENRDFKIPDFRLMMAEHGVEHGASNMLIFIMVLSPVPMSILPAMSFLRSKYTFGSLFLVLSIRLIPPVSFGTAYARLII